MEHLKFLKDIGYLIATGSLAGLPGQTREDLIDDVLMARSFGAEMYSFGPFIPHPDTPLKDTPLIAMEEALKFIAVARLMAPDAKILVTTALETLGKDARRLGLLSGANSFMLNVTPVKYRRQYEIYKNRANVETEAREQVKEALKLLKDLGRAPTDLGL
jgi:biotin synthase